MSLISRAAATLAAGALVLTTAGTAGAAADDTTATWLGRQLTDGLVHNDQYGFDDYGLTADTAFAMDAVGGQKATLREIRKALAEHVDSWTTGVDFGSDDVYSGSVAKAVVVAEVTGADPRSFGGVDVVKRLQQRVSTEKNTMGRVQDKSSTDYANTIGQAFAARGLAVAGSPKAGPVVKFLLKQQCSTGFFRLSFADASASKQGCDAGTRKQSAPDTDVTALAVINLTAIPKPGKRVRAAIDNASDWLFQAQKKNGSFGGGPATEASNANSTGLAGWAFGLVGACVKAQDAASWVKDLQVHGDVSGTPLAGEKGAIAYDRAAFNAAEADGITTETQDQWRRSTTQAAPSLSNLRVAACAAG
jgi:hypothetical protein